MEIRRSISKMSSIIELYLCSRASRVRSSRLRLVVRTGTPASATGRLSTERRRTGGGRFNDTVLLIDRVPCPYRWENVPVIVGVPLLLDVAELGLGLGLGLGGPSDSVSSEPDVMGMSKIGPASFGRDAEL